MEGNQMFRRDRTVHHVGGKGLHQWSKGYLPVFSEYIARMHSTIGRSEKMKC